MTDDTVLDTTIHEPSMTAGEVEMLLFALERSRAQFAWKCGGLDAAGLNRPHPPSTMTLGGLLKHLALVEDCDAPCDAHGRAARPAAGRRRLRRRPGLGLAHRGRRLARGAVRAVAGRGRALAGRDGRGARRRRARPARRSCTTDAGESPEPAAVLVDLHDEYARHVGHADLLREAVDGLVGEDPPQP